MYRTSLSYLSSQHRQKQLQHQCITFFFCFAIASFFLLLILIDIDHIESQVLSTLVSCSPAHWSIFSWSRPGSTLSTTRSTSAECEVNKIDDIRGFWMQNHLQITLNKQYCEQAKMSPNLKQRIIRKKTFIICSYIFRPVGGYQNEFSSPTISGLQPTKVSLLVWKIGPEKPTIPSNDQILQTLCKS